MFEYFLKSDNDAFPGRISQKKYVYKVISEHRNFQSKCLLLHFISFLKQRQPFGIRGFVIHGFKIKTRILSLSIRGFLSFRRQTRSYGSVHLIFAVIVLMRYFQNPTPTNNEGRLYLHRLIQFKIKTIDLDLKSIRHTVYLILVVILSVEYTMSAA